MPYVKQHDREPVDKDICSLGRALLLTPMDKRWGLLNYMVTELVGYAWGTSIGYNEFNSAIGALEAAKLEMYRRALGPYEDKKKNENGDVSAYMGR